MIRKPSVRAAVLTALFAVLCAVPLLVDSHGVARAAATPVNVFPIPGSRVAPPKSQITFRGLPAGELGSIVVVGSRSGTHAGTVEADSDGQGGSFIPSTPFTPGEQVTVQTGLNIVGGSGGRWQFTVATPAGGIPASHWMRTPRNRNDVMSFHSRPDLRPVAVRVTKRGKTAAGDIFVAPQFGPLQVGPMLLDSSGNLIWFKSLPGDDSATDFRVQSYRGQPVLTWWQGYVTGGQGVGEDVIDNSAYEQIATVQAGNGLAADLHEFRLTSANTALITSTQPVRWDLSSVHGSKQGVVFDSVVQEIDIPTGLVLYQWDSLDHVPVSSSYQLMPKNTKAIPYDYFHVNAVSSDSDGNLIVSSRNTWAAYKLDHKTGAVIWTLGGRHSSFKMGNGAQFAFQHDVQVRSADDWFVTAFDDGAGPPVAHKSSRALKLFLDLKHHRAVRVQEFDHSPPLLAGFEGNYQQLPGGDVMVGWGQQPYFSEYNSRGQLEFDAHFVDGTANYRAYRFPWTGTPQTTPAVAASTRSGKTTVWASWNGATGVSSWRILAGSSPSSLSPVATVRKNGFETAATIGAAKYVAVQALGSRNQVMSFTKPIAG